MPFEESTIYDLTVVTPPSLFLKDSGPKILLLGEGDDWKAELIEFFKTYWANNKVTIYYADKPGEEVLPWLYYQCDHVDFILANFTKESTKTDLMLFGLWARDRKTFLTIPGFEDFEEIRVLYHQYNSNVIEDDTRSHMKAMKTSWQHKINNVAVTS